MNVRRRLLTLVAMFLVVAVGILWIATDPGTISATAAAIGPNGDYVKSLEAKAAKTGKQLVWVGYGLTVEVNGTTLWALPHSSPILFDKADVPRPFDQIRNRQTRREINAAFMAQKDLARMEGADHLNERVATSVGSIGELVDRLKNSPALKGSGSSPEVAAPRDGGPQLKECGLGDVCDGCYSNMGTFGGVTWCGYACTNCKPKSQ